MARDWQRAFGEPLLACELRTTAADFRVDEQLGFEFSGDGEHDYLHIEKVSANTSWVARGLARFAGVRVADVGYAGMKDRHAVATQWYSVPCRGRTDVDWARLDLDGVRVLEQGRHRRKLRRGAHVGNRFRIALRNLCETGTGHEQRLQDIRDKGVPNYFGEQRFGHDGGNIHLARELFAGTRLGRSKRSIAISAARSFLFNEVLDARVRKGNWDTLLVGDCAMLDGSGSFFRVEGADEETRRRCESLDVHPSGPLWGNGVLQSGGETAELEQAAVARHAEIAGGLRQQSAHMARRALRLAVRDFVWERVGDTLWLEFFLVRGGYATAVLREIASYHGRVPNLSQNPR